MGYDANDAGQVKQRKQTTREAEDQRREDMRRLLQEAWGRRILWDLLSFAGVYHESFTGDSATFYNEGRRSVGLKVLGDIHAADITAYATMLTEQIEDRNARAAD